MSSDDDDADGGENAAAKCRRDGIVFGAKAIVIAVADDDAEQQAAPPRAKVSTAEADMAKTCYVRGKKTEQMKEAPVPFFFLFYYCSERRRESVFFCLLSTQATRTQKISSRKKNTPFFQNEEKEFFSSFRLLFFSRGAANEMAAAKGIGIPVKLLHEAAGHVVTVRVIDVKAFPSSISTKERKKEEKWRWDQNVDSFFSPFRAHVVPSVSFVIFAMEIDEEDYG